MFYCIRIGLFLSNQNRRNNVKRKYSQVAGLFNKNGFNEFMAMPPLDDGTFHFGLKGTLGPIPLTGEKSGFDFQAEIEMDWLWQWNNGTQKTTAEVSLLSSDDAERPCPG